jgi:ParB-like chromosome segregation protein Spo0J
MLKIAQIRRDGGTQPRAGLVGAVVRDYMEAMQNGETFPPVVVFHDGDHYWLADGYHRVDAAHQARLTQIAADIRQGTKRDAVLYSVGANATHGLKRSNEDKRRAVKTLLRDAEWGAWSDRAIARACAVGAPLVADVRRELAENERLEAAATVRNYSKNGNTAVMNTANIGARALPPAVKPKGDIDRFLEAQVYEPHPQPLAVEEGSADDEALDWKAPASKEVAKNHWMLNKWTFLNNEARALSARRRYRLLRERYADTRLIDVLLALDFDARELVAYGADALKADAALTRIAMDRQMVMANGESVLVLSMGNVPLLTQAGVSIMTYAERVPDEIRLLLEQTFLTERPALPAEESDETATVSSEPALVETPAESAAWQPGDRVITRSAQDGVVVSGQNGRFVDVQTEYGRTAHAVDTLKRLPDLERAPAGTEMAARQRANAAVLMWVDSHLEHILELLGRINEQEKADADVCRLVARSVEAQRLVLGRRLRLGLAAVS